MQRLLAGRQLGDARNRLAPDRQRDGAATSITATTGATIQGRLLAETARGHARQQHDHPQRVRGHNSRVDNADHQAAYATGRRCPDHRPLRNARCRTRCRTCSAGTRSGGTRHPCYSRRSRHARITRLPRPAPPPNRIIRSPAVPPLRRHCKRHPSRYWSSLPRRSASHASARAKGGDELRAHHAEFREKSGTRYIQRNSTRPAGVACSQPTPAPTIEPTGHHAKFHEISGTPDIQRNSTHPVRGVACSNRRDDARIRASSLPSVIARSSGR